MRSLHTKPLLILTASLVMTVLIMVPVHAQYSPQFAPGTTFVKVTEQAAAALAAPHPLLLSAQEATGLRFEYLVEIQAGMSRRFEWTKAEDERSGFVWEQDVQIKNRSGLARLLNEERIYPTKLYVGLGLNGAEGFAGTWLASFSSTDGQTANPLAQIELSASYVEGLWVIDLTNDGWLEVMVPWVTGVAGGGGIDIVQLTADGELLACGEVADYPSVWSYWGSFELIDWDADGASEIQVTYPLIIPMAGYFYNELLAFDSDSQLWLTDEMATDFGRPQCEFYRSLVAALEDFASDPSACFVHDGSIDEGFYVELEGDLYAVEPFCLADSTQLDQEMLEIVAKVAGLKTE